MARLEGDTAELVAERDQLEARLLELRRIGVHRTRASALERVDESLREAEAQLTELLAECRHRLATRAVALPTTMLAEIAALTGLRDGQVGDLLRDEVRRDAGPGEANPFADDLVAERSDVEARLLDLGSELELRSLESEAVQLEGRHRELVDRIGGGAA